MSLRAFPVALSCLLIACGVSVGQEPPLRLGEPNQPGSLLRQAEREQNLFLDEVEQRRRIQTEIIKAEVEDGLARANEQMASSAEQAKTQLKLLLEGVERAPDLDPAVRAQLRGQIESAVREAGRRQVEQEESRAMAEENRAAALERQRLIEATARREMKIKSLMARMHSLMQEGRYREAEEQVAYEVRDLAPNLPEARQAVIVARTTRFVEQAREVRELSAKNYVDALFQVERSHIPFPDDPPIVYPDPEVWQELTIRRKKYASIDLAKRGSSEERIFQALEDDTQLEFIETPLQDVIEYLEDLHNIQIEIDTRALQDVGLGTDTPITRNLRGISLRSALRLMLKELDLTYVVRDEVLLITTPEEAESQLITKVYPVADLVLPINTGAGANPFMLGGGLGGMGGFGGGMGGGGMMGGGMGMDPFGGGGGMMGGGMMGGGMQGGLFAVPDRLGN